MNSLLTIPWMSKKIMIVLLTLLFTCLTFFCLLWTKHSTQAPMGGSCFLPGNTCLIIARFWLQFFLDLHKIWCCSFVRSTAPAAWNFVHWLPRYASTIIYCCITTLQLLYRWRRQSRKLWISTSTTYWGTHSNGHEDFFCNIMPHSCWESADISEEHVASIFRFDE
jgi:hypothetical protein